jgi:predicted RNase H-like HicB family nuclease
MNISVRIEIFKEGDVYIALSPELNVSSFGETIDDAKKSFKEALEAFIEECQEMGTLEEVLEESGFSKINNSWESRKPIVEENLALSTYQGVHNSIDFSEHVIPACRESFLLR